jgi:hypothetical protein
MDEIFGYFPPVANPPSKPPLLTLVKQARAFGLGIVLSTQNPVDLDYKGLSNTGTWLIGRLQTDRDKERVLDGLEGAAAGAGGRFDRAKMGETLAGLGQRIFLMNNVHDDEPVVFESRWVMSYLRGPLTREQIRVLMEGRRGAPEQLARTSPAPAVPATAAMPAVPRTDLPALAPGIAQFFLPVRGATGATGQTAPGDATASSAQPLTYTPALLASGRLFYTNAKAGIATQREITRTVPFAEGPTPIAWDAARESTIAVNELESSPRAGARFGELPREAAMARSYTVWTSAFKDWLYRNAPLVLWKSPSTGLLSAAGESERDFRIRIQQNGREQRDAMVERLRGKYAARINTLEERIRRAEYAVQREREQADQQKLQAAISLGATILTAFGGRRAMSRSTLGRATTTARGAGRVMRERQDVERATETLGTLQAQLAELQTQVQSELAQAAAAADPLTETLERLEIRAKKTDIEVTQVALVWIPDE